MSEEGKMVAGGREQLPSLLVPSVAIWRVINHPVPPDMAV